VFRVFLEPQYIRIARKVKLP